MPQNKQGTVSKQVALTIQCLPPIPKIAGRRSPPRQLSCVHWFSEASRQDDTRPLVIHLKHLKKKCFSTHMCNYGINKQDWCASTVAQRYHCV